MEGKTRCKLHGGASTGPKVANTRYNALKHGLYSQYLSDEERENFEAAKVGDLDDEIKLLRVRLARAIKLEASGDHPKTDFDGFIDRTLSRLESLENARKKLLADGEGGGNGGPGLVDPDPDV